MRSAIETGFYNAFGYYFNKPVFAGVCREFESLCDLRNMKEEQVRSTGYVMDTLQAPLWCLLKTSSHEECVLTAVNLGSDTDTTAAVAGSLAGLWYGEKAIPKHWREVTAKYEEIKSRLSDGMLSDIRKEDFGEITL